ncbi:MAG: 23S rRNA (guanosine(2251)-2'-O)-methyltransferase RlmB [Clostridiales bacterium]|nr:23S rRNA (guanosine(2251)-2'-O)-methyltransferase RlmB [Clostridiales bacterium]
MYKGKIPHKWLRGRYDTEYLDTAPHMGEQQTEDMPVSKGPLPKEPESGGKEPFGAEIRLTEEAAQPAKTPEARQQRKVPATAAVKEAPHPSDMPEGLISGKNAVLEALRSGQTINRVLLAEGQNGAFLNDVIKKCRENGVQYQFLPKARLAKIAGPDHRGVACELSPFSYAEPEDMLEAARLKGEPPLLLLLDGVEDPHNLGAVMRTALCAGAHGIIIPKRRSAAFTATVARTSAGASAHMPLARVSNLTQTARALKQAGLWLAAADMDGQTSWQADLSGPLALVLGGEGEGISPLLKRHCDLCVSLPVSGPVASLNVSAAAAALLYEVKRQRSTDNGHGV